MALLAIAIPIEIVLKICISNTFSIAIVHKNQLYDLSKGVIILLDNY